jgi:hypothetical protein
MTSALRRIGLLYAPRHGCTSIIFLQPRRAIWFTEFKDAMPSPFDGVGQILGATPGCGLSAKRKTIKTNQKCNEIHGEMKETTGPYHQYDKVSS